MNPSRAFSVVYMFAVSLVFMSLVAGIYVLNAERIELNEQIKLQGIILRVLQVPVPPDAEKETLVRIFSQRVTTVAEDGKTLYVARNEDGAVTGYAFPLYGPGFWGSIRGMMAVDPELKTVLGIAFYSHSETPGLGGRITEAWFQDQFKGKPLMAPEPGGNYFELRPPGTADQPNEVDAVTGATETSRRLEVFLNRNLKEYLAWIEANKTRLSGGRDTAGRGQARTHPGVPISRRSFSCRFECPVGA